MHFTTGSGWQEAVTSVRDLGRWTEALDHLAGWSVVHRGDVDKSLLAAWQLPEAVDASEAVLICPQDATRWLRLVSFKSISQQQIRSSGQAWETGGIFSILAYSADTQAAFERAQELGWSAHNDPVLMEFGERELLNVVLRGPDGCNFGLYEPLKPAPEQPAAFPKLGAPFNGQQMVRDVAQAQDFYANILGWQSWYAGELTLACNNFGIPSNLVGVHPKRVAILHAREQCYGQTELVEWTGFEGRDFSSRATPPNLGHLALRWPVDDLQPYIDRCRELGVNLFVEPTRCDLAPCGEVLLCTVRTPDGVMIELVQPLG